MTNGAMKNPISEADFRNMFLKAVSGTPSDANVFFDSFDYRDDLADGEYSKAFSKLLGILNKCLSIDAIGYETIHKGTAFYWAGTLSYLTNDHETATFFFDAAVSEDLRAGADPIHHPTPSMHFILVEGEQPLQAARQLVQSTQARIEELLRDYNSRPGRTLHQPDLTMLNIRDRFLRLAITPGHERWRSLATAFISFCLEWDYRNQLIDARPGSGTAEPFFLHLFKGCVLFESLLKANPSHPISAGLQTLGPVLRNLHSPLNIPSKIDTGGAGFPQVLSDLAKMDNSIQSAIELTGKLRNSVGHDLGWVVQLDKIQYHRLFRIVTASCFHAIANLYV